MSLHDEIYFCVCQCEVGVSVSDDRKEDNPAVGHIPTEQCVIGKCRVQDPAILVQVNSENDNT